MDNSGAYLILGASGGIGSAILTQATERHPEMRLIGTARSTKPGANGATLHSLDYLDPHSIAEFCRWCDDTLDRVAAIICATGFLSDDYTAPEKRLCDMRLQQLQTAYQINAAGPLTTLSRLDGLIQRSPALKILGGIGHFGFVFVGSLLMFIAVSSGFLFESKSPS